MASIIPPFAQWLNSGRVASFISPLCEDARTPVSERGSGCVDDGERAETQKTISSSTTLKAGSGLTCCCGLPLPLPLSSLFYRDFSKLNALDRRPDNREATHLGGEHVNLIGALTNVDFLDSRWRWWS